jgi:hypothetical protein
LPTHAHFEELCVLATSGQLSPAESDLLNQHLLACANCRSFFKDTHLISDKIISRALHTPRSNIHIPAGMRERFFARAATVGLQIDAGPPVEAEPVPNNPESLLHGEADPSADSRSRKFSSPRSARGKHGRSQRLHVSHVCDGGAC